MREPPRCPFRDCPNHKHPTARFFRRHGTYRAECHDEPVRRFRCKACERTFSEQTFRSSYRDKRPDLNWLTLILLSCGVGFRFGSRRVGLSRRCYVEKARKIARNIAHLDTNLQVRARRSHLVNGGPGHVTLQMDELHTFEGCSDSRPVIASSIVERESRFAIASEVGSILPSGKMTPRRMQQIARDERRHGKRIDESPEACKRAFGAVAELFPGRTVFTVESDESPMYPQCIRETLGGRVVMHSRTSGSAPRDNGTSLFPIHLFEAIARDHLGRLRSQSWLHTKERHWLKLFMDLHRGVKNWATSRFNGDRETPAQFLGIAPRALSMNELIGFRQDWGQYSPCPFGDGSRSMLDLHWKGVTPGPVMRVCA